MWNDKYPPKNKNELMLPGNPVIRRMIDQLFLNGSCPYAGVLCHDTQTGGTGKTTFVNMLADELVSKGWSRLPDLESSGNKVSDLEDLKSKFEFEYGLSRGGLWGKCPKSVVICNEISESSTAFIKGLRSIMDSYHQDVLFLFTDNYYDKLNLATPSMWNNQRVVSLNWDTVPLEDIKAYCIQVLAAEGKNTSVNRALLDNFFKGKNKTSIRAALSYLEMSV